METAHSRIAGSVVSKPSVYLGPKEGAGFIYFMRSTDLQKAQRIDITAEVVSPSDLKISPLNAAVEMRSIDLQKAQRIDITAEVVIWHKNMTKTVPGEFLTNTTMTT